MKRFITLVLMLSIANSAIAQSNKMTASIGMTYHVNDFKWSIAGSPSGQSPNILSELDFKKITSVGFFVNATYKPLKNLEIIACYQRGTVVSGEGRDVDYQEDNRTSPTDDLSFSSDKGKLHVFKGGVKTPLLQGDRLGLATALYYYTNIQDFYILSPEMAELESTYTAKMKGVDLALEATFQISKKLSTVLSFDCSFINYKAEANWNLRDIFKHPVSFAQSSRGVGTDVDLKVGYKFNPMLSLVVGGAFGNTKVYKGTDTSYLITNTEVSTQFNGAKNSRYSSMVGLMITL